jgi:hypothetical protein
MAAFVLLNASGDATSAAESIPINKTSITFHAILRGTTGSVSSTVVIYGSNDPLAFASPADLANAGKEVLATLSMSGTGATVTACDSDKVVVTAPYQRYWATVSSTTGTGCNTTVVASS